ncbi:hypothetical protein TWF281_011660 [Arthrobotrys megalospora]
MIVRYDETRAGVQQIVKSGYRGGALQQWREVAKDQGDAVSDHIQSLEMRPATVAYSLGFDEWEIVDEGIEFVDGDVDVFLSRKKPNILETTSFWVTATAEQIASDWMGVMSGRDRVYSEGDWRAHGFDPDDLEVHPWPLRYEDYGSMDEEEGSLSRAGP